MHVRLSANDDHLDSFWKPSQILEGAIGMPKTGDSHASLEDGDERVSTSRRSARSLEHVRRGVCWTAVCVRVIANNMAPTGLAAGMCLTCALGAASKQKQSTPSTAWQQLTQNDRCWAWLVVSAPTDVRSPQLVSRILAVAG